MDRPDTAGRSGRTEHAAPLGAPEPHARRVPNPPSSVVTPSPVPNPQSPQDTKTRLHLGCGHVIKEGWVNHDLVSLPGVDVVHDLRQFPWPFEDGQFVEVFMKDVLEHVPDTIKTLEELYRITKPGAKIYITVPYWNSWEAIGDPTHIRQFNEFSFDFFDPRAWQCKERPYYSHARFYIRRMGLWITPFQTVVRIPRLTRDYVIFNRVGKKILLVLASFFCNVVAGLDVHLERAE